MATDEDSPAQGKKRAMAAAAGAGWQEESAWARQGREAIQSSHILNAPLVRWTPEPVAPNCVVAEGAATAAEPEFAIPEKVLKARPALRLPEDVVCRSPIAGLVIAVMASAGEPVTRRQPVLVIEAMKMQNYVSPEADGVVKAMHVAPGDAVKTGQVLFELE